MIDKVKIGDICYVYDGPHATPTKTASGPIYLGIDAITEDGRLNPAVYNHLSEPDYQIWTKRVVPQEGDIVFSYEATLGRYAMIPRGFYGCLGRRLAIVRSKDEQVNPRWLYYYFLSPEWNAFIANSTVRGSTVNRISVDDFPNYTIPLPKRFNQDNIVKVLAAIDQKRDNNINLCHELELMAKTIYDYWFTQFDFPDEEGKPYRSSGGEMVWNEQLKREIPKGWVAKELGDVCTFRNGINYDKDCIGNCVYRIANVRNITASSLIMDVSDFDEMFLPREQADRYVIKKGDIIIARSGTPGATRLIINPADNVIFCGFIICCTPSDFKQKLFLTYFLKQLEGTSATKTGGSILQNVSQDTLKSLHFCLPKDEVIDGFNERIEPIIAMIQSMINENRELTKLRDWLLPMLMNGQARVE